MGVVVSRGWLGRHDENKSSGVNYMFSNNKLINFSAYGWSSGWLQVCAAIILAVGTAITPKSAFALKLCTFELENATGSEQRIGVLTRTGDILDLNRGYALTLMETGLKKSRALEEANAMVPPNMIAWLEQGEAGRAAVDKTLAHLDARIGDHGLKGADGERLIFARREVRLLAPIPRPTSLRDAGGFLNHMRKQMNANEKGRQIFELFEQNPLFITYASTSVAGTDADILWPNYSDVLDYELEIAVVIGRKGKNIPVDEAKNYIAGYTIYNDVSARDYQIIEMTSPLGSGKGKSWDGGNLLGPYLVTPDEFNPDQDHAMIARVNGEEWGRGSTSSMYHKFSKIVSFISQEQTLYPGDVIASATVENGSAMEVGKFINPGDVVELEIEGIGVLKNKFVKDPTAEKKPFPTALATLLPNQLYKGPQRPLKVVEVAKNIYAGIQVAPGFAGYSNMMYVAIGEGLVADTLLDIKRTQKMIDLFRQHEGPWPPKYLVNSHADSDHVWGNELFKNSEIIGHKTLASMSLAGPKQFILAISNQSFPKVQRDFVGIAKEFDLRDITVTPPSRLISDGETLDLDLNGVPVHIKHLGPAHKESDVIIYLPQQKVLFAGDLVFNGLTPHMTGTYENVINAYKYMESLKPDIVIPGHDDITDAAQITKTRKYFEMAYKIAKRGYAKGLSPIEAAKEANIGEYANWHYPGQIMISLNVLYTELGADLGAADHRALMMRGIVEAAELEEYWKSKGVNQPSNSKK